MYLVSNIVDVFKTMTGDCGRDCVSWRVVNFNNFSIANGQKVYTSTSFWKHNFLGRGVLVSN